MVLMLLVPTGMASGYLEPSEVSGCSLGELSSPVIYNYNYVEPSDFIFSDEFALVQYGDKGNLLFYARAVEDLDGNKGVAVTNYGKSIHIRNLYKSTQMKNLVNACCARVVAERVYPDEDYYYDAIEVIDTISDGLQQRALNKNKSPLLKRSYIYQDKETGDYKTYNPSLHDYTVVYIFKDDSQ